MPRKKSISQTETKSDAPMSLDYLKTPDSTTLLESARRGDIKLVQKFVEESGLDVNLPDDRFVYVGFEMD